MDLNEISVFVQVVKSGSFSQAAKELAMPNSTVSARVSALEKRLGTTLIQRTTRRLNITPAGRAYYKRCLLGLEEIRSAEDELAASQGEPQGLLRITAPVELGGSVLPQLISKYTARFPKVAVEVLLADRRVDLLSESVDLAIRAGELKDSSLIAKKLGTVYFAPFASPKYIRSRGRPEHPRELRNHECLQFTPLGFETWKLTSAKGSLEVPLRTRVIVNDMNMLKQLAVTDQGIALLPSFFCGPEVKSGRLVRILPDWKTSANPVHFVYPAQKFVMPKLAVFMEMSLQPLRESLDGGARDDPK